MFGERDPFEDEIQRMIDLYPLDELFDLLDISAAEVLSILLQGGHVNLPPWIERGDYATPYEE